jgi:hypothetical protein
MFNIFYVNENYDYPEYDYIFVCSTRSRETGIKKILSWYEEYCLSVFRKKLKINSEKGLEKLGVKIFEEKMIKKISKGEIKPGVKKFFLLEEIVFEDEEDELDVVG